MALTPKQLRFVEEYLLDLNATQAAIRAGYSARTAATIGYELRSNPEVAAAIKAAKAERSLRTQIEADDVLRRWWDRANADPNELVELQRRACRYCYGRGNRYQRTAVELQRDREKYEDARAKFDAKKKASAAPFAPFDEKGGIGYDPRKAPNAKCQRCWGDGVERVLVKDTRHLSAAARELYAGVKVTRWGISVQMRDQDDALTNVAKHLGMLKEQHELSGPGGGPMEITVTRRIVRPGAAQEPGA